MPLAHATLLVTFITFLSPQEPATPTPTEPTPPAKAVSSDRAPADVKVPLYPNANCPIMGKPVSTKLYTETVYGRIYMCCKACTKKIKDAPQTAYKAAYPTTTKVNNATCPVSGETIKATPHSVTLQGYEIALCCESCTSKAQANAQITLALALDPTIKDLHNPTCPITGDPVANDAYCIIGNSLVHLSHASCITLVRADPNAVLEKASKSVASKDSDPARDENGAKTGEDADKTDSHHEHDDC